MSANYDFSRCMFDFTKCPPHVKLKDFFTQLSVYEEFNTPFDREIKIAICLSDFDSPFIRITESDLKLKSIFEFLEIGLATKANQEFYETIYNFSNNRIGGMCARYIQLQNNHDYSHWWTLNQLYYDLQKEATKPKEQSETIDRYVAKKLNIQKQMASFTKELKELEAGLFNDTKLKRAIVQAELEKKIRLYPEMLAMENQVE